MSAVAEINNALQDFMLTMFLHWLPIFTKNFSAFNL